MAFSLGEKPGATVGYRTRYDQKTSASTRVDVVTEGIFLRQIQHDPELNGVSAVIFDEFHERAVTRPCPPGAFAPSPHARVDGGSGERGRPGRPPTRWSVPMAEVSPVDMARTVNEVLNRWPAAGLAVGFWKDLDTLRKNWRADRQWEPTWSADRREESYRGWQKAVERTLNWVDVG